MSTKIIIDFDSTISRVEALEELAKIRVRRTGNRLLFQQIKEITDKAMSGRMSFDQSLVSRLKLLNFDRLELAELIGVLENKITNSFIDVLPDLLQLSDHLYVISGGFREFINPILKQFGFSNASVYANELFFDESGLCVGLNGKNPLAGHKGKVTVAKQLEPTDYSIVIGDGFTDYEIKEAGLADTFIAYTEHIRRPNVITVADYEASDFYGVIRHIERIM